MLRFFASSRGVCVSMRLDSGIDVIDFVCEEVESEDEGADGDAWEDDHVRHEESEGSSAVDHGTPIGGGWWESKSKESEDTDGDGGIADA